ncbi:MAG TPA: DegV family protein [Acidimicrobiales bacterium]|nr:DegV family protein [Acidimicrobiales bacterium]
MLIVVDGACDLPPALRDCEEVVVVPFHVLLAGSPFVGKDDEFDALLCSGAKLSSAPPGDELFTAAFGDHRDILVVTASTYLSAAVEAATFSARRALADVRIVDSRTFSAGSGLVVNALREAIADGIAVSELGKLCGQIVEATHTYAIVDRPQVLVGHGLLGKVRLSHLFCHPVLGIRDRARLLRQTRSRKRAIAWLIHHLRETLGRPPTAWAVAHASSPDIDGIVATLREVFHSEPVFVTTMNPTAAIHLGHGAVVVAVRAP